MGTGQVYCTICGAPIVETCIFTDESDEWLKDAVLLTTGHETEHGIELDEYWPPLRIKTKYPYNLGPTPPEEGLRSVLRFDASTKEGTNSFVLSDSGECVDVMCVKGHPRPGPDHGASLYLPLHRLCMQVADNFIDSVPVSLIMTHVVTSDGITSTKNLWEVLSHRLQGDRMGVPSRALTEPHDYFGGQECRNVYWDSDDKYGELLEQDPINIPGLTESILQNLEPAKAVNANSAPHQSWYFEAFINQQIFPWLWDLDTDMILEKQRAGNWNWELLVRKLSIKTIHEPDDKSIDLPLQLRNRRRIWRLLEEARIHDVAGEWEKLMAMNQALS